MVPGNIYNEPFRLKEFRWIRLVDLSSPKIVFYIFQQGEDQFGFLPCIL